MSAIMLLSSSNIIMAEESKLIAFPGAEGGGMYTQGARAGDTYDIYHVTNLNDSGDGSFRKAVSDDNRIIVFDVSGTIMLESAVKIKSSNLTILGQTAPGEGICIGGNEVSLSGCDNIIIRYLRFRGGTNSFDALSGRDCSNVIIDHCSVSWSTDECFSWYGNTNFTAQWNIISEALRRPYIKNDAHGYGGLWGGTNASFHHNLLASNDSRNPRIATCQTVSSVPDIDATIDVRNNVVYNWKQYAGYGGENGVRVNFVNNYFKPTANSTRILFYVLYGGGTSTTLIPDTDSQSTTLHISGNVMEGNETLTNDNWSGVQKHGDAKSYWIKRDSVDDKGIVMYGDEATEIEVPDTIGLNSQYLSDYPVVTQTAEDAYSDVLKYAGASYKRDAIDERIVNDVINGTYTNGSNGSIGFIDNPEDVGGWCYLYEGTVKTDSDGDGIPDEWEDKNGLDKNNNADAAALAASGYTNIEEYANSLVEAVENNNVDRQALNLAILRSQTLDLSDYYEEDVKKIQEETEKAKTIFGTSVSQQEIDEITDSLNALIDDTDIVYKPVLQAFIQEVNAIDKMAYTIESYTVFQAALDKANADLLLEEDNVLLKADYENLKSAYEGLEASLLSDLQVKLENINTKYIQNEADYTSITIDSLMAAVEQAQQLIDTETYTNENITEAIAKLDECVSALEKINFTILNKYINILENGILGAEYITISSAVKIENLKAEGKAIANSNLRENDTINEFVAKVADVLKNDLKYLNGYKNIKFSEGFDSIEDVVFSGGAAYILEDGNACVQPEDDFIINLPVENWNNDTYLSTDFKLSFTEDEAAQTMLHAYELDGTWNCSLAIFKTSTGYCLRIYYDNKKQNVMNMSDIPVSINSDEWNNVTSNYNSDSGYLKIYYNNALVYNNSITNNVGGSKSITGCSISTPGFENFLGPNVNWYFVSNKNNYIDNIEMFEFSGVDYEYIYGDADATGDLTANDASVVLQKVLNNSYTMPLESVLPEYMNYLDVDCSGDLSAADSAQILQKVLNNSFKMSVEK